MPDNDIILVSEQAQSAVTVTQQERVVTTVPQEQTVVTTESHSNVAVEVQETFVVATGQQGPPGVQGVQGVQGIQGEPGGAVAGTGDLHYTHAQAAASNSWVVPHNLGKYPSVSVVDSGGTEVEGSVVHDSTNQLTVSFSSSFAGSAHLN